MIAQKSTQYDNIDGNRVKIARKYREITQLKLSDLVKISQSNISFIESGRHNSSREITDALCKVLDVTRKWLLGETSDGGVPIPLSTTEVRTDEKEKVSKRFATAFDRLKALGIIESDAEFCRFAEISQSNLSLALAGKSQISFEWVPFLEKKGANRDFIYNGLQPVLKLPINKGVKDIESVAREINILIKNIEEETRQLKFLLNKIL
jgi:transcriptional regulator with XRE-family HTH domain